MPRLSIHAFTDVDGYMLVPIEFVRVNATVSGDNTIISGIAGKRISVLGYAFNALLAVSAQFKSTPSGNIHAGPFELAANGSIAYAGGPLCPAFETEVGEALTLNLSLATNVRGHLTFVRL